MRRRAWSRLRLVVEVVHYVATRNCWGEPGGVDGPADREPVLIVAGMCLGAAILAAVRLVGDFLFGATAIVALYALRELAATRLRVVAGWALTAWGLYFLLSTSLLIVGLLILGVVTVFGGGPS
jgi:hypothetical protein